MTHVSATARVGLLLASISILRDRDLPAPTATAAIDAMGVGRTAAYAAKTAVEAALPHIVRPPGRPPKPPDPPPDEGSLRGIHQAILKFIYDHPGCVSGGSERRRYSDGFRCLVLDLAAEHHDMSLDDLAEAVNIPLGTMKDWLRGERPHVPEPVNLAKTLKKPTVPQVETVLAAWEQWGGGFIDFCEHVQLDHRIPFNRHELRDLLEAHGVRIPNRRRRPPDASAMREGFETFFPGAQWVGDGTELIVEIAGQRYRCNLELDVDVDTGALVGASIRPTEDAAAVVEAFEDGVATTGDEPLVLLLDNKPSNHAPEVDEALGETLRVRARPFEPTDKAHVEGAFGLFSQVVPPLRLTSLTPAVLAMQVAALAATIWARATNHRPRADRGGRSRVQLYRDTAPTEEDVAEARAALAERHRKQERARQTRARRQDPVVRTALDDAFERLGLEDPDGHLRTAIASWPLDAVLAGIAIFEGKQTRGTLPEGADGRYLRGIVKNVAEEEEGWVIAEVLLRERLAARDRALDPLVDQREAHEDEDLEPEELLRRYVDLALATSRRLDRQFWLLAAVDVVKDQEDDEHRALLRLAARRISSTHRVKHRDRLAAIRFLFAKAVPLN